MIYVTAVGKLYNCKYPTGINALGLKLKLSIAELMRILCNPTSSGSAPESVWLYCPEQLPPARMLSSTLEQMVFRNLREVEKILL